MGVTIIDAKVVVAGTVTAHAEPSMSSMGPNGGNISVRFGPSTFTAEGQRGLVVAIARLSDGSTMEVGEEMGLRLMALSTSVVVDSSQGLGATVRVPRNALPDSGALMGMTITSCGMLPSVATVVVLCRFASILYKLKS